MNISLGRTHIDDHGVHSEPFLGFIGRRWSLAFDAITSWVTVEERMTSRAYPEGQCLARLIELHHAGGRERVRWGRGAERFDRFVSELERRLPGKRAASRVQNHSSNEWIPR